jgi:hypothetical protein
VKKSTRKAEISLTLPICGVYRVNFFSEVRLRNVNKFCFVLIPLGTIYSIRSHLIWLKELLTGLGQVLKARILIL